MAPQTVCEPSGTMNTLGLSFEFLDQCIVLYLRTHRPLFARPMAIQARSGARRPKDQIAVRIGHHATGISYRPVSYTHLTLPTSDLV